MVQRIRQGPSCASSLLSRDDSSRARPGSVECASVKQSESRISPFSPVSGRLRRSYRPTARWVRIRGLKRELPCMTGLSHPFWPFAAGSVRMPPPTWPEPCVCSTRPRLRYSRFPARVGWRSCTFWRPCIKARTESSCPDVCSATVTTNKATTGRPSGYPASKRFSGKSESSPSASKFFLTQPVWEPDSQKPAGNSRSESADSARSSMVNPGNRPPRVYVDNFASAD